LEPSSLYKEKGKELLLQGKVGALLVAGGQGSRMGGSVTCKGALPVTVIKKKSLFQIFAERVKAASSFSGHNLPLAIMTSPLNHQESVAFFKENHFFGLQADQVFFFMQEMLPYVDEKHQPLIDESGAVIEGPSGNGEALKLFYKSGIWQEWKKRGIDYVTFSLIDNPLADPFDLDLLGVARTYRSRVVIKAIERHSDQEKVGILLKELGKWRVVEYMESESALYSKERYPLANISLFVFSMRFIKYVALHCQTVLHLIKKRVQGQEAYKQERFIFDLLPFTSRVKVLKTERALTFAPLKNLEGENSLLTTQEALQYSFCRIYEEITGLSPSKLPFELAWEFYYPTENLKAKWKGKRVEDEYIEA
jgi:UDP-N-acetylglucosamine/UDP-N-acetylgalactosamine diphosphorylase